MKLADTEITRVGLGTNRLRHAADDVEFIREAVAAGVNFVDTAHVYTGGDSERAIGEALSPMPDDVVVATKGGYAGGMGRPEALRAQIEESLRRLRTDTVDLYYLHRVDPETPLEDSLGEIASHRDAGRIRHVGISAVEIDQIERARKVVPIAAVQNHYNLAERRYEDVVDHCEAHGIAFVPYYPLQASGDKAIGDIAERHGATPAQVALAWLLKRSPVVAPIPGTKSLDHLRENLAAAEVELSDAEFEGLSQR